MTGAETVAHGPHDGTIALMMSNAHAISAVMYKTLPYDPVNDFQMVSMVATAGLVLVTAPDFPANNLSELVALVRANPGKYNFGQCRRRHHAAIRGRTPQANCRLTIVHVPYRTTPAAVAGLLGKEVSFVFEFGSGRAGPDFKPAG